MAIRHVRAVQEHSQIDDDLTRHILEIIALDIGEDDSPAYTSNRKIAQRARCAVNTARDKIQTAVDSGELIQRVDGKYTFYQLNIERLPYGRTSSGDGNNQGAENEGKKVKNSLATADDLAQLEERLYQRLCQNQETLYQTLYQQIVSIVSTVQRDADPEVKKESIIKEPPHVELAKHFQTETGCLPNLEAYRADWEPVLNDWIERWGMDGSRKRITAGAAVAKGANEQKKKYVITSPRSMANIIANLPADFAGAANGIVLVRTR